MPRMGRVVLPNYPHHIVQRGHNRKVVFAEDEDYEYFLATLRKWKETYGVKVYAYCLMTNHIHLVLEPPDEVGVLGRLMKRLAGRQTRYADRLAGRRGTLWESCYKFSVIQMDNYLLACCRYVELNPVRARMVDKPEKYRWSSYRSRVEETKDNWLDSDPSYMALGKSWGERRERYMRFMKDAIPQGEWQLIREAVHRGQLTGDNRFVEEIEEISLF